MASLSYLWKNRARFPITSIKFYRAWGKRILLLGDVLKKNRRFRKLSKNGANIHNLAEIGEVKILGDKRNFTIGANSFLGKVEIALHDKVTLGNNICINDGSIILSASHDIFDSKWPHKKAEVIIEDYVWVGTEAMILPGVRLGRGCVVGARAVVSKSVEPGEIVVGNPAKKLNKKRDIEFDYNPCEFIAANRAWLIG